jgi:hypothetical protein
MKKIIPCAIIIICIGSHVAGQSEFESGSQKLITVFDVSGQVFTNPFVDVTGSQFFKDEWITGNITMQDKSVYHHWRLRVNCYSQEIHFLSKNDVEMVFPAGFVKSVELIDTANSKALRNYFFETGFPAIDKQNETSIYRVLSNGKIKLLAFQRKIIHSENDVLAGGTKKEFQDRIEYYFFSNNRMEKIKKQESFFIHYFGTHQPELEAFIKERKLSFKSPEEIQQLTNYFNSLQ